MSIECPLLEISIFYLGPPDVKLIIFKVFLFYFPIFSLYCVLLVDLDLYLKVWLLLNFFLKV